MPPDPLNIDWRPSYVWADDAACPHGWRPASRCPDCRPAAELDEWRTTYGRLDIPVTVIDWRPVYAGAAALGIALVARWMARR